MTSIVDYHSYYEKNILIIPKIVQRLSSQHAILFLTYNWPDKLDYYITLGWNDL